MLTFLDAITADPVQRKALKDLMRPMIWDWAGSNNLEMLYDAKLKVGEEGAGSVRTTG